MAKCIAPTRHPPVMRLVLDSRLEDLGRATELVDAFRSVHGLAERDANALHIVLDELLSNTIRYGLGDGSPHQISLALDYANGEIVVEIEDDGIAFDPTRAAAPDVSGTLSERKVGGVGIAFVRALTDSIEYRRIGERNRLVLRRRPASTSRNS